MRRFVCFLIVCLLLTAAGAAFAEENLIRNGGFDEATDGWPHEWLEDAWLYDEGVSFLELSEDARGGAYSAWIENAGSNDARFIQHVAVQPDAVYRLSGFIRAEGCSPEFGGANLSVLGNSGNYPALFDTQGQWEPIECYVRTTKDQNEITVAARLGFYGSDTTGMAWFDDISLTRVDEAPAGAVVISLEPYAVSQAGSAAPDTAASNKSVDLFMWTAAFVALCIALYVARGRRIQKPVTLFGIVLLFAAAIRLYLMATQPGYPNDMMCFFSWAGHMADVGPASFYQTVSFCDYPPGYMLMLWFPGALLRVFGITELNAMGRIVVKLYPLLADMGAIWLLFTVGRKRLGDKNALLLSVLYAFSPAVLLDGAVWGQIDAVLAVGLFVAVMFAVENRWHFTIPVFVATVLMKPQALMAGPVGLAAFVFFVIDKETRQKALRGLGFGLLFSVPVAIALLAPFLWNMPSALTWLYNQYTGTLGSYAYATINTANFYYMLGANWKPLTESIGPVTFQTLSTVLTVLSVAGVLALYAFRRGRDNLPFFCALALIALYLFGTMMHERYLFPALILLLYAYVRRPDKRLLALFAGFCATFFLNCAVVLRDLHLASGFGLFGIILAVVNLALFGLAVWTALDRRTLPLREPPEVEPALEERLPSLEGRTPGMPRLRALDWALMIGLTAIYAATAYIGLGSGVAPQTVWKSSGGGESVVFDLGEPQGFEVMYYGEISSRSFSLSFSEDGEVWTDPYQAVLGWGDCFQWQYLCGFTWSERDQKNVSNDIPFQLSARYIKLIPDAPGVRLMEVVFRDLDGNPLPVVSATGAGGREGAASDPWLLVDEPETMPEAPSYMNSMYFDEIYHGRTGYEHAHQLATYETTHPPLGKIFIMWGIELFGMTPFGWRFMGTLMGVLMVPAMYLMGMLLFRKRNFAFIGAFVMAFDLMHLTQTRIATIDSYAVLFIILMYLCMVRYLQMSFFRDGWRTLVPLGFSGLFMGLGCASKWIGIYAGAGLGVLFLWSMAQRYLDWRAGNAAGGDAAARVAKYPSYLIGTLLSCVGFFVVIPAAIYYCSYIPYFAYNGGVTLKKFLDAQASMFDYHANLVDDHAFASPWYEWPLILKPMYYYTGAPYSKLGVASTIMCMGNPAVWWVGFAALLSTLWRWLKPHVTFQRVTDHRPALLLLGFAAQFLPWMLVPRTMFIYHYFGSLPFVMLMIAFCFERLYKKRPERAKVLQIVYMSAVALLFAAFYPVATGVPVPANWIDAVNWLRFVKMPGAQFRGWIYY